MAQRGRGKPNYTYLLDRDMYHKLKVAAERYDQPRTEILRFLMMKCALNELDAPVQYHNTVPKEFDENGYPFRVLIRLSDKQYKAFKGWVIREGYKGPSMAVRSIINEYL